MRYNMRDRGIRDKGVRVVGLWRMIDDGQGR